MLMSSCVDSDCVVFTFSLTMHSLPCGYLSEWAEGRRLHVCAYVLYQTGSLQLAWKEGQRVLTTVSCKSGNDKRN